jgi:hypothetical protein
MGTMRHTSLRHTAAILLAAVMVSVSTASGQTKAPPKPDELDRLLAPVALYPDQLLAQMLLCATKPGGVAALNGWLTTTTALKGSELQDAAVKAGFEPSFVALVLFPQTVKTMADQIDWTTRLGQAFTAYRSEVFASIQRLRAQARAAGTLKTTAQQEVETRTTSSGQEVIVIEPANPQIVYVPQYNPTVVYTQPSTVVIENNSSADAAAAGMIGFAAGIAIGAAMDNDYYYGPYGWRGGAYMYNDAWDDYYDAREDAREDWYDHREDVREDYQDRRENLADERGDRAQSQQQQRTERQETRQENRPEAQAQREQRRSDVKAAAPQAQTMSQESRGYSGSTGRAAPQSGTGSDAFSGYSSGRSERAASSRGQSSRSSSRSGGGRRR